MMIIAKGLRLTPSMCVNESATGSMKAAVAVLLIKFVNPYSGLIQVSSAPLRAALAQLGQ